MQSNFDFMQRASQMVIGLAIVVCSMEMVPGWGIFQLNWPPAVFYLIMALAGGFAGACAMRGYPLPGLAAGPIGGIGALAAVAWYLARVNEAHGIAIMLAGAIGALPAVALFFGLKFVQDLVIPPQPEPEYVPYANESDGYHQDY